MQQSIGKNIVVTILRKLLNRLRLIDAAQMQESINYWVKELSIKIPSTDSPVQTLSGGNQQRVVLSKWLATKPKILILDGPTIGIDVAAKSAIYQIIKDLAKQGLSIILISDEIPEVFHTSNRIIVMHKGKFIAEFDAAQSDEDEIQHCINMAS